MESPSEDMRVLRFGPFEANFTTGELCKHGIRLKLQDQPFHVLKMLLARPGELVTREEIRQALWPSGTFVDFDNGLNAAINRLRETLGDSAEHPKFIETLPRRGYRFIGALGAPVASVGQPLSPAYPLAIGRNLRKWLAAIAVVLAVSAVVLVVHFRRTPALTEKDVVVLADFANTTGEPVFDDTLKQALAIQLEQSPFLNLLSDQQVRGTMQLMGHSPGERVTQEAAREICQRTGSVATLAGSIAKLGENYVIGLRAFNCRTGDTLAQEQVEAGRREHVLRALGQEAAKLRTRLGESLKSIQKFDTPIVQATTPSLEALQAYSLGVKSRYERGEAETIPFFKRATELDPNFAMAYYGLAVAYANLGQYNLSYELSTKALALSDRTSEREKLMISSLHLGWDWERYIQNFKLWEQTYPRDPFPRCNLGSAYSVVGQYEKAVQEVLECKRLNPNLGGIPYAVLMRSYTALDRFDEAKAVFQQAQEHHLESPFFHFNLYAIAFLENDAAGMESQVAWGAGKPGAEDALLSAQADKEAFFGHLQKAREFSRRAVGSAQHNDLKETAAIWQAVAALREAEFGNAAVARQVAREALTVGPNRDLQAMGALALARAGDAERARLVTEELEKRWPSSQAFMIYYASTIRATIELDRGNADQVTELLRDSARYELAELYPVSMLQGFLYPAWLRGQAYLRLRQGAAAAGEFQKFLDHRSIVRLCPLGALAHLGLGRAFALQGDTAKARAAYQDFLSLWKDADPDIPILKQAISEYAKLQ